MFTCSNYCCGIYHFDLDPDYSKWDKFYNTGNGVQPPYFTDKKNGVSKIESDHILVEVELELLYPDFQ